jgi:hypothetical protein
MAEIVLGYGAPPLPFGSVDDIGAFGAYVLFRGVDPLNLGAHEGQHYLLVASPFRPGLARCVLPIPAENSTASSSLAGTGPRSP